MSFIHDKNWRIRRTARQFSLAVFAVLSFAAAAQAQSITQPSARVDVPAARDWATEHYQDPINMGERTDLGWFVYANDQPRANLSNIQLTGGRFSATAANGDPGITILDTANPVAVPRVRTGNLSSIDAGSYRTFAVRMRLSGTAGVRVSDGQFFWTSRSLYESPVQVAGSFWTYGGWQVYLVDIPTLGGSPWSGIVRWLRFDPTTVAGSSIEIDWIRLVGTSDAATFRTITWTGGAVDIYLDDDKSEANGTLGLIARNGTTLSRNQASGSFQFQPGALPGGDYYVAIRRAGSADALKYSAGFYRVGGTPTLQFTSPSPEGSSDDFAVTQLGNAWDLASMSDVDSVSNSTGVVVGAIQAENTAGTSLGTVSGLLAKSLASGATGDPYVHLLFDQKRGASKPIDTSRYRILTFDLGLPGARDMANGSVARVVWKLKGESAYNVSEDIVVNHRAGSLRMDRTRRQLPYRPA
jgi:hypothetical protein